MKFRIGFLGAWALFVIALGAVAFSTAAEIENIRDDRKLSRLHEIDRMIAARIGGRFEELKTAAEESAARVTDLRSKVARTEVRLDEAADTAQTIVISTAENRLWVQLALLAMIFGEPG